MEVSFPERFHGTSFDSYIPELFHGSSFGSNISELFHGTSFDYISEIFHRTNVDDMYFRFSTEPVLMDIHT
jgi:hypothetical protein